MNTYRSFIMLAMILLSSPLLADALAKDKVPEPLQPWINWVLQYKQDRNCPFLYNSFAQNRCAWPSRINIDLYDKKGQFTIDWTIYSESWIRLPGSNNHWPLNVMVNDKPALVMQKHRRPEIKLPVGNFTITGDLTITTPGVDWKVDDIDKTIEWTAFGDITDVHLEFYDDQGRDVIKKLSNNCDILLIAGDLLQYN